MVRGQRSNQLSYVPTCFSTTYKQVQQSTVFSCWPMFRPFLSFPQNLIEFCE